MGQYYKIVNIDKKQWLDPHMFSDGIKLLEFGCNGNGAMTALAVLLADGNGRGGGDLTTTMETDPDKLVGSWAGDRIVIAGDYADKGGFGAPGDSNLYIEADGDEAYEDISSRILKVLYLSDDYLRDTYEKMMDKDTFSFPQFKEVIEDIRKEQSNRGASPSNGIKNNQKEWQ